jgi:HNH endonuclease
VPHRICSVETCERTVTARGWCTAHYKKWAKYGDPLAGREFERVTGSPADRFWAKVDKNGPVPEERPELGACWIWTKSGSKRGYGSFRPGGERRKVPAHRWSYEAANGPIPEGLELDHLCRNHPCVRPSHLEAVTHRVNMQRGKMGAPKKLSDAVVLEIRSRLTGKTGEKAALANEYGVSTSLISLITSGDYRSVDTSSSS